MILSDDIKKRFRYKSKEHDKLVQSIIARERMSYEQVSKNFEMWNKAEETKALYVKETDEDSKRKTKKDDGYPQYTTLHVPYSYAMLQTDITYYSSVLLGRSPVAQFEGRHGEAENQVQSVESIMEYQLKTGENMVPLYIWISDIATYNLGIMGLYWEHEKLSVTKVVEKPTIFAGVELEHAVKEKVLETTFVDGYVGNRGFNIKPHHWRPDPRVPVNQFQSGEFCGRVGHMSWNELTAGGQNGEYFNLDIVAQYAKAKSRGDMAEIDISTSSSENAFEVPDYTLTAADVDNVDKGRVPFLDMVIELQPAQWKLADNKAIEKWRVIIAYNQILIHVGPLGLLHNKYPYVAAQSEIEGYGMTIRPKAELLAPLNDALSWLFNAHFYNVRKTLNDSFIVDPSKVVMADVINPAPGRVIRLKPVAYGQNINEAVKQLQNIDITRSNISDAQIVSDMMQRAGGAADNLMGVVNQGRKTATEVRASATSSVNRMSTSVEYISHMGFGPFLSLALQQTQQLYEIERKYKLAGDTLPSGQDANKFIQVSPEAIAGFYDFVHVDGNAPRDKYALGSLMLNLMTQLETMQSAQLLSTRYDFGTMLAYIAKFMGWRNIDRFKIEVSPDQELQRQAQLGNMVQMGGGNGGGNVGGTGAGKSAGGAGGGGSEFTPRGKPVNAAAQTSGLGPAG